MTSRFGVGAGLRCKILMPGYGSSRDVSDSLCDGLTLCIAVRKAGTGGGRDKPVEHAEARHHSLLSANVPTGRKLHRKRNFRIVRAMDRKTSPAIAIGAAVLKFGTKLDYLGKVLIGVLVLYEV